MAAGSAAVPERAVRIIPSLRFLVVDDVAMNRRFLIKAIQKQLPRAVLEEVEDGTDAVAAVRADLYRYQVVLMDKEMQRMDGYTATRALREMGYRGIVLGVTANALGTDVAEFMRHGVNAVVTKPVNVGVLLDIVERHMTDPTITVAGVETVSGGAGGSGGGAAPDGDNSDGDSDGGRSEGGGDGGGGGSGVGDDGGGDGDVGAAAAGEGMV